MGAVLGLDVGVDCGTNVPFAVEGESILLGSGKPVLPDNPGGRGMTTDPSLAGVSVADDGGFLEHHVGD